ncbi:phospholipase A2-like isoform X2 [Dendropsophus ebraccatus]
MALGTQAGILEFGLMVNYVTGRLPLTSYAFYGCHCGLGGSGQPVDEIDWCCRIHDCCYDSLPPGLSCSPLGQAYKFSRINGTITCDDEDGAACGRRSCDCDRAAALCFQEHNQQYSRSNSFNFYRRKMLGAATSVRGS